MQEREDRDGHKERAAAQDSEFVDSLRKGLLIGAALAVLLVPPIWVSKHRDPQQARPVAAAPQSAPVQAPAPQAAAPQAATPVRLADFNGEDPSPEVRLMANWVVHTGNNRKRAFVLVDKADARVYVFSPEGKLKDSAPTLLGAARGDDSFPGIGDKPLDQVRPEEKTTPAGRFVAEPGMNTDNEDVVWVDYDAAVSMHRIRPKVAEERRLERLASLTIDDNRISFGCINLPVTFYENVLSPTVKKQGAIVYVLPEVKSLQEVFGAYDVTDPTQLASARAAATNATLQRVALRQAR